MTFITEPTPSLPSTRLYHGGRGGAGNYHRVPPTTTSAAPRKLPQPPTTISTSSASSSNHFFSGRGGSGNVHHSTERTIFSFDEELERDRIMAEHQAPVYSVGRGGAGNIVPNSKGSSLFKTKSVSSRGSGDSESLRSVSTRASGSTLGDEEEVYGVEKLWRGLKKVSSRRSQA